MWNYQMCFWITRVWIFGHIVAAEDVKVDQGKIIAMLNGPRPTGIYELRGFLGFTSYYCKFVHNYGLIAHLLTNLLKKG